MKREKHIMRQMAFGFLVGVIVLSAACLVGVIVLSGVFSTGIPPDMPEAKDLVATDPNNKPAAGEEKEEKGVAEGQDEIVPVKQEKEVFVFRAKYFQTKGPCIKIGNAIAMPVIDAFEVVEVVKGNLKAKSILVRPFTRGGSAYPQKLTEGKVYTLRLTLSERTKQKLQENDQNGTTYVGIDGDQLEEDEGGKQKAVDAEPGVRAARRR
jgi:hypothetical protein